MARVSQLVRVTAANGRKGEVQLQFWNLLGDPGGTFVTNGFVLSLTAGVVALIAGVLLIWSHQHIGESMGPPSNRSSEEATENYLQERADNPPDEEVSQLLLNISVLADRSESLARGMLEVQIWTSPFFFILSGVCFLAAFYQRPAPSKRGAP